MQNLVTGVSWRGCWSGTWVVSGLYENRDHHSVMNLDLRGYVLAFSFAIICLKPRIALVGIIRVNGIDICAGALESSWGVRFDL